MRKKRGGEERSEGEVGEGEVRKRGKERRKQSL